VPLAVEVGAIAQRPCSCAAESPMLTVQLGGRCLHRAGRAPPNLPDRNPQWTGSFVPAGRCVTLFALLTPLGSGTLDSQPRPYRESGLVAELSIGAPRSTGVGRGNGIDAKLQVFAQGSGACLATADWRAACARRVWRAAARQPGSRSTSWHARPRCRAGNSSAISRTGSHLAAPSGQVARL
jgi:hypothetical protein